MHAKTHECALQKKQTKKVQASSWAVSSQSGFGCSFIWVTDFFSCFHNQPITRIIKRNSLVKYPNVPLSLRSNPFLFFYIEVRLYPTTAKFEVCQLRHLIARV